MNPAIFIESDLGPKYGLTIDWQEVAYPTDNSTFPFCSGGSMSLPSARSVQDRAKQCLFGNLSFTGTGLSLMGMVDLSTSLTNLNHSLSHSIDTIGSTIDGGPLQLYNLSTLYATHMYEFYTTGPLLDGQHVLNLTQLPLGIAWDWGALTPGPNTTIRDFETLVVDDADEFVIYNGNWEQSQEAFLIGSIPALNFTYYHSGYGGSVHIARTVNDTMRFPFTGTSISLHGFFRWDIPGSISATFQIDNISMSSISYPFATINCAILNQTSLQVYTEPNFNLYTSPSIPAGDHILTMKITEVVGEQSLILDNIRYSPSFDTLSSMPHIVVPPLNQKPAPSRPTPRSTMVGPISGGVVGGFLLLAVLAGLGIRCARRKRSNDDKELAVPDPFLAEKSHLPPDFPPEALVFDDAAPRVILKGRNRRNTSSGSDRSASSDAPALIPPTPLAMQGATSEEEERRVQELEMAVQRATRENEILAHGWAVPPAYVEGQS